MHSQIISTAAARGFVCGDRGMRSAHTFIQAVSIERTRSIAWQYGQTAIHLYRDTVISDLCAMHVCAAKMAKALTDSIYIHTC